MHLMVLFFPMVPLDTEVPSDPLVVSDFGFRGSIGLGPGWTGGSVGPIGSIAIAIDSSGFMIYQTTWLNQITLKIL